LFVIDLAMNQLYCLGFAVAVYDVIMGSEQAEDYDTMRKGITWFQQYFPKQYMVLLD